nr:MAG TPA: hypothetical protein [Caudoviricetes sp.]
MWLLKYMLSFLELENGIIDNIHLPRDATGLTPLRIPW